MRKIQIYRHLDNIFEIVPTPMYWLNPQQVVMGVNSHTLQQTGAMVSEAFVGKTVYDLYPNHLASHIAEHNDQVILQDRVLFQEETIQDISSGELKTFIAIKAPLRDDYGKIVGVAGISFNVDSKNEAMQISKNIFDHSNILEKQGLPDYSNVLMQIIKSGILDKRDQSRKNFCFGINKISLTKREIDCLKLIMTGKTIKMVSNILGLSPRTVEGYLENLKRKFNVNSKAMLIEKVLDEYLKIEKFS